MRESGFWAQIKSKWETVGGLRLLRVENAPNPGTPDLYVAYKRGDGHSTCWIELKIVKEIPKRVDTVLRIDHYTAEQRLWLKTWGEVVPCWLFAYVVGHGYYLFDHEHAQDVGLVPFDKWQEMATMWMPVRPKSDAWLAVLRRALTL